MFDKNINHLIFFFNIFFFNDKIICDWNFKDNYFEYSFISKTNVCDI